MTGKYGPFDTSTEREVQELITNTKLQTWNRGCLRLKRGCHLIACILMQSDICTSCASNGLRGVLLAAKADNDDGQDALVLASLRMQSEPVRR
jgi:hypothetical protein